MVHGVRGQTVREVKYLEDDARSFLEKNKGKQIDGTVVPPTRGPPHALATEPGTESPWDVACFAFVHSQRSLSVSAMARPCS